MLQFLSWYMPNPRRPERGKRLPSSRKSFEAQSILFPKETFTVASAKAWLKKHGYRYGKVDEAGSMHRFRQVDPGEFLKSSFRTISFGDSGILAVVAVRPGKR